MLSLLVERVLNLLRALLAQVLAFAGTWLGLQWDWLVERLHGWTWWLALDAALAVLCTIVLRLSWWWWIAAAACPVLVVGGFHWSLPWWLWASAFGACLLIFGGGLASRVPLYLSQREVVEELARLLPATPGIAACDLGAGLGGPVLGLARRRPDARVVGVEASPLPWLIARWRCRRQANARIVFGDLFRHPLHGYALVYAFLSPAPMAALWAKVRRELAPGSLFVSNTFPVPEAEPEAVIPLPGRADARLYLYRVPLTPGPPPGGSA